MCAVCAGQSSALRIDYLNEWVNGPHSAAALHRVGLFSFQHVCVAEKKNFYNILMRFSLPTSPSLLHTLHNTSLCIQVKEANPNVSTVFYYNSVLDFPQYDLHGIMLQNPELMLRNSTGGKVMLSGGVSLLCCIRVFLTCRRGFLIPRKQSNCQRRRPSKQTNVTHATDTDTAAAAVQCCAHSSRFLLN